MQLEMICDCLPRLPRICPSYGQVTKQFTQVLWDIQYPASDFFFFLNKTQAHLQDFEPGSKLAPAPVPSRSCLLITCIFSASLFRL